MRYSRTCAPSDKCFRYENICVSSRIIDIKIYLSSSNIWVTILLPLPNCNLYTKTNICLVDLDNSEDSFALRIDIVAIASPARLLDVNFRNESPASDI